MPLYKEYKTLTAEILLASKEAYLQWRKHRIIESEIVLSKFFRYENNSVQFIIESKTSNLVRTLGTFSLQWISNTDLGNISALSFERNLLHKSITEERLTENKARCKMGVCIRLYFNFSCTQISRISVFNFNDNN